MFSGVWVFFLYLLLPANPAAPGKPIDRAATEAKLRTLMVGRVAIFQHFYKGNDLHFDSTGTLIGGSHTGSWTAYGGVEIDSVKLGSHSLVLAGRRNVRRWEGDELTNYTLDTPVRVELDFEPNESVASLVSALEKVFLFRAQRLSDIVPGFWKDFLTTERGRSAAWRKEQSLLMKDVKAVAQNITPPRLLSGAGGIDIAVAPFQDADANTFTASFIVGRDGAVKDVQIIKPVGVGVDDAFAEKIARWKFAPAMSGSRPVEVLMYSRVLIHLPNQRHLDPAHMMPCPNAENVFAC